MDEVGQNTSNLLRHTCTSNRVADRVCETDRGKEGRVTEEGKRCLGFG